MIIKHAFTESIKANYKSKRYQLDYNQQLLKFELVDYDANRIVYTSTSTFKESVVEYVNRIYGKNNILDNTKDIDVIKVVNFANKEAANPVVGKEIKSTNKKHDKIVEVFAYIDKYRVGLEPKFNIIGDMLIINLVGAGSEMGDNKIEYDMTTGEHIYYHKSKIILKTRILEKIFE